MLLYIKNLPPDATKNHIRALFAGLQLDREDITIEGAAGFLRFHSDLDLLHACKKEDPRVLGSSITCKLLEEHEIVPIVEQLRKSRESSQNNPHSYGDRSSWQQQAIHGEKNDGSYASSSRQPSPRRSGYDDYHRSHSPLPRNKSSDFQGGRLVPPAYSGRVQKESSSSMRSQGWYEDMGNDNWNRNDSSSHKTVTSNTGNQDGQGKPYPSMEYGFYEDRAGRVPSAYNNESDPISHSPMSGNRSSGYQSGNPAPPSYSGYGDRSRYDNYSDSQKTSKSSTGHEDGLGKQPPPMEYGFYQDRAGSGSAHGNESNRPRTDSRDNRRRPQSPSVSHYEGSYGERRGSSATVEKSQWSRSSYAGGEQSGLGGSSNRRSDRDSLETRTTQFLEYVSQNLPQKSTDPKHRYEKSPSGRNSHPYQNKHVEWRSRDVKTTTFGHQQGNRDPSRDRYGDSYGPKDGDWTPARNIVARSADHQDDRYTEKVRLSELDPFAPGNRFGTQSSHNDRDQDNRMTQHPWSKQHVEETVPKQMPKQMGYMPYHSSQVQTPPFSAGYHTVPTRSQDITGGINQPPRSSQTAKEFVTSPGNIYEPSDRNKRQRMMQSNTFHPEYDDRPRVLRKVPAGRERPVVPQSATKTLPYAQGAFGSGKKARVKNQDRVRFSCVHQTISSAEFKSLVTAWIAEKMPLIKLKDDPDAKEYNDEYGTHHSIIYKIELPYISAFPPIAMMGNVICSIGHSARAVTCPACRRMHPHTAKCPAVVKIKAKHKIYRKVFVGSGDNVALDPKTIKPFTYKAVEHQSVQHAINYLLAQESKQDLDSLVPQARNYWLALIKDDLREVYKALFNQHKAAAAVLKETGRRYIAYVDSDFVFGTGIIDGFDIHHLKFTYLPGINLIGTTLTDVRMELWPSEERPPVEKKRKIDTHETQPKSVQDPKKEVAPNTGNAVKNVTEQISGKDAPLQEQVQSTPEMVSNVKDITLNQKPDIKGKEHESKELVIDGILSHNHVERFKTEVLQWMGKHMPHVKILTDVECEEVTEEDGTVHHLVKCDIKGPVVPIFPSFAIIDDAVCMIKSPFIMGDCCQVCRSKHPPETPASGTICKALRNSQKPPVNIYFIPNHPHHFLSPMKMFPLVLEGVQYPCIMTALSSLLKRDFKQCDQSKISRHKKLTWKLRALDLIKDLYRQLLDGNQKDRNKFVFSTKRKDIICLHDDRIYGSGSFRSIDGKHIKKPFFPGANIIGKALMELRTEFLNENTRKNVY